jgi:probable F420-dependent oxidoreductase
VGSRVLCNDYRHPAILAKEAATLDLFSEGRLELGLGAGWLRNEYDAAGIPFDKVSVRIERLEETIRFLRQHFGDGMIDAVGPHLQIRGYEGVPKPLQKPHPPLMIGGGSRRILGLAAREADIVSFNFNNRSGKIGSDSVTSGSARATAEKVAWVRDAAGDRFPELELEVAAYFTHVTEAPGEVAEGYAQRMGLPAVEIRNSPHSLMGSVEEIADLLLQRREEYGFSYVTVSDRVMKEFAPVVGRLAGN